MLESATQLPIYQRLKTGQENGIFLGLLNVWCPKNDDKDLKKKKRWKRSGIASKSPSGSEPVAGSVIRLLKKPRKVYMTQYLMGIYWGDTVNPRF